MSSIHVLNKTGDESCTWEVDTLETVDLAAEFFQKALEETGGMAVAEYKTPDGGTVLEAIQTFDPAADRIVVRPRYAGG